MPDSFLSRLFGFGSDDKDLRMKAIGNMINKAEYDIYLLEELWMRADHNTISGRIPDGWSMTTVPQLSHGHCEGNSQDHYVADTSSLMP